MTVVASRILAQTDKQSVLDRLKAEIAKKLSINAFGARPASLARAEATAEESPTH